MTVGKRAAAAAPGTTGASCAWARREKSAAWKSTPRYFKGNFPESCSLEVCTAPRDLIDPSALGALPWKEILARTKLQADSLHVYEKELLDAGEVTHARFHIYPDGGVARLRIFGNFGEEGFLTK